MLETKILLAEVPRMAKTITTPAIMKMTANLAGESVRPIIRYDAYYDGFIDGCMDANNSREVCEQATDA